ncbi:Hsp20/alpha crystallin family protein [Mesorhizobium sp. M1A.F.Ca.ET.072.01.1.1]|nr:Hsp20/alpha crystallin family protein [Mesorhizobium sp. M1A.F.Ca.ET.072.01.1.1]TIV01898.1 MAG: Hsp20 family protein [Mesorhizobium sp.]
MEDVFRRLPEPVSSRLRVGSWPSRSLPDRRPIAFDPVRFRCTRASRVAASGRQSKEDTHAVIGFGPCRIRSVSGNAAHATGSESASGRPDGQCRPGVSPGQSWVGEDSVALSAELPGIAPDEVELTVRDNTLTLKGECESRAEDEKSVWHRRERPYGSFSRTVQLPFRVDPEQVEARFGNGVLEVELHRPEADRPKKIQIKG